MRKVMGLLLLWIHGTLTASAQLMFPAAAIPADLKHKANAVVRNMETTVDMRAADQVVITVKKTVTVLNQNGDVDGALQLFYNKNSVIKSIRGEIYDAFGMPLGKFTQAQFKDESAISNFSLFEDDRIKYYQPSMVSYPYTIHYEYELRNAQNLLIPDWYPQRSTEVAVERTHYRFLCNPADELNIKAYALKEKVTTLKDEKKAEYSWEVKALPALAYEPYAPPYVQYLSHVKIAPIKFSYYKVKGEYRNWQELGAWMYQDLIQHRQMLPQATVNEIKSLISGISDQKEQAKMIYAYVQKKTRYISVQVGIGGFQPAPAAEVDALGYGDCKGLVNYTQSLLKAVGIPSYYCIVHAGSEKRSLDPDFASMNQANHVILCLPLENETVWLECTSQTAPFGFLGTFTDDRLVLACTREGGKLLRTPELKTASNMTKRTVQLSIDEEGSLQGKMVTVASGAPYDDDEHLVGKSTDEQLKSLKENYDIDNIEFTGIHLKQVKSEQPSMEVQSTFDIKHYVSKTENRAFLLLNPFNKLGMVKEPSNRHREVYINRGFVDEDEISYQLPENFAIEAKPRDLTLSNAFGTFTARITVEGKVLTYHRKLTINNGTFKAETYTTYVSFINAINRCDWSKVIFTLKSAE